MLSSCLSFFLFIDPSPTDIYTLSLHDALPILRRLSSLASALCASRTFAIVPPHACGDHRSFAWHRRELCEAPVDRKSTRLNSSHSSISYAVFCLKKKKNTKKESINTTQ